MKNLHFNEAIAPCLHFAWWVIFHAFCCLLTFFKINFFKTDLNLSGTQLFGLTDQDHVLSVLIWAQTVCKGYQQMTNCRLSKERVDNKEKNACLLFEGVFCGRFNELQPKNLEIIFQTDAQDL